MEAKCLMKSVCPRRNEKDASIKVEPIVKRSANLCGEMITMGKNVNARIIQTTPHTAKIVNVVKRSLVCPIPSILDLASDILADAQFINPADSSSACSGWIEDEDLNIDLTDERTPAVSFGEEDPPARGFFSNKSPVSGV